MKSREENQEENTHRILGDNVCTDRQKSIMIKTTTTTTRFSAGNE